MQLLEVDHCIGHISNVGFTVMFWKATKVYLWCFPNNHIFFIKGHYMSDFDLVIALSAKIVRIGRYWTLWGFVITVAIVINKRHPTFQLLLTYYPSVIITIWFLSTMSSAKSAHTYLKRKMLTQLASWRAQPKFALTSKYWRSSLYCTMKPVIRDHPRGSENVVS